VIAVVVSLAAATTGFAPLPLVSTTRAQHSSSLHVLSQPTDEQKEVPSPSALIPEEETASFYDIEYDDDDNDEQDDTLLFTRDEDEILTEREDRMYVDDKGIQRKIEKCLLVGVENLSAKRHSERSHDEQSVYFSLEESMKEMKELIKTAGLDCVGEITQRLQEVNPKTYVGSGKVEEAKHFMEEHDCCTIVFDAELTPGQQKALENAFNKNVLQNDFLVQEREIKVIDRTALILDIFAQHAKTREGKLQVDLALHEYRKPRLTKMWTHLERQSGAGGVGLRGPGESQLEIDRRLVRDRIITLKQKIDNVQKQTRASLRFSTFLHGRASWQKVCCLPRWIPLRAR